MRHLVREHLPRSSGAVALTFDDGPDAVFTPLVLDELDRLGVAATFFVVGARAAAHPHLVRRIAAAGHAIGSHSRTHPEPDSLGWRVVADFACGRRDVERAAARRVNLFRPPKGYLSSRERWAMRVARVEPWLWTIDTADWEPGATVGSIVAATAQLAAGDVVLLHDGICGPLGPAALDRSATVAAIDGIVTQARARGLQFATLERA